MTRCIVVQMRIGPLHSLATDARKVDDHPKVPMLVNRHHLMFEVHLRIADQQRADASALLPQCWLVPPVAEIGR